MDEKKEPRELKTICDEVMAQFGGYSLIWNNCQHFLKAVSDLVISEEALDWSWFRENTKTEYQEAQALRIPAPDEVIAANRATNITANGVAKSAAGQQELDTGSSPDPGSDADEEMNDLGLTQRTLNRFYCLG